MIDYGGGLIFRDSWAFGPPDPPLCPDEDGACDCLEPEVPELHNPWCEIHGDPELLS